MKHNFSTNGIQAPALTVDQVHIWTGVFPQSTPPPNSAVGLLSNEELVRAAKLHRDDDQCRFLSSRLMLRTILGAYLQVSPQKIAFVYGTHGKPRLDNGFNSDLRFNLSHSQNVVAIALTRGRRIGLDIEKIIPDFDMDAVTNRFFSRNETAVLESSSISKKSAIFFTLWVRKEAFLKALGIGLSPGLCLLDFSNKSEKPYDRAFGNRCCNQLMPWSVNDFKPSEGYVGAIVIEEKKSSEVKCCDSIGNSQKIGIVPRVP